MAGFIGNFKGFKGNDATAVRKKKFAEGTLRYSLYKHTQVKFLLTINFGLFVTKYYFFDASSSPRSPSITARIPKKPSS